MELCCRGTFVDGRSKELSETPSGAVAATGVFEKSEGAMELLGAESIGDERASGLGAMAARGTRAESTLLEAEAVN